MGIPAGRPSNFASYHRIDVCSHALDPAKTKVTAPAACREWRGRLGGTWCQTPHRSSRPHRSNAALRLRHPTCTKRRSASRGDRKGHIFQHSKQPLFLSCSRRSADTSSHAFLPSCGSRSTDLPDLSRRFCRAYSHRSRRLRSRAPLPPHFPPRMRRHIPKRQLKPLPNVQEILPPQRLLPKKRHERHGPTRKDHETQPRARQTRAPTQRKPRLQRRSRNGNRRPSRSPTLPPSTGFFQPAHCPPHHLRSYIFIRRRKPTNDRAIVNTATLSDYRRRTEQQ